MITWTSAGAVERPTMVQIRVQRAYPGRVRAGAPVPTRSMTPEEVLENLRFFTRGLDTPRSQPCARLVLSGAAAPSERIFPESLRRARAVEVALVVRDGDAPLLWRSTRGIIRR